MKDYRGLFLFWLMIGSMSVHSQFDSQVGLYMFSTSSYNPAGVGEEDLMKISGLHRMQYIGVNNAPMVTYAQFS